MEVPCIAVLPEDGEESRQLLAEAGVLDDDHQIVAEDDTLYIPVTTVDGVPDRFETQFRDLPARRTVQTPADSLGYEPSLERLGDVVIVDEDDPNRAAEIAEAVMESDLPARSVLNRASKIKGELRVRDWEVLAERETDETVDRSPTETVHREYGHEFLLDLAAVYFSPRLATERHRVIDQIEAGEHVLDMFAGVGPFAIPAASRGAEVVAVDLNETAIDYLQENARRNGVNESITAISGDVRAVVDDYRGWADRLVMNLPHSADEFVETAVDLAGEECVIHYYDIQHDSDPFGPGIEAIRAAAEPTYEVTVETEHVVKSYAPHELNVCLDVRLTRSA
ncbi:tRNA (guanine37-N1)-methyltransferase [Halohasta litchfieldiae]|jgi:tRNA (guanine37-N1)-methyltransferase|uniref:Methyltransferase n=1 Tax=Halohasta litchfieldiae TaxID=1073996 RepID=A0A1H6TKP4_9EURY|nr:class I SAM-dependent methyltransferase family protein [Halohasta litchfieldiae]ATW87641.1 tRNA (guanine37-N1)-methyltransferase [Halohasta litchfieldiae]SEI76795.1 methyltransferase [Halohasta litchfieldiae]